MKCTGWELLVYHPKKHLETFQKLVILFKYLHIHSSCLDAETRKTKANILELPVKLKYSFERILINRRLSQFQHTNQFTCKVIINVIPMGIYLIIALDFHYLCVRCALTSLVAQTVKASTYNVGDLGLIPGLGRSPWRRKWQPTPVLLPGKSHGLMEEPGGYSPCGCKESDTTEWLHFTCASC